MKTTHKKETINFSYLLTEGKERMDAYAYAEFSISNISNKKKKLVLDRFIKTSENLSEEAAWEELNLEFGL